MKSRRVVIIYTQLAAIAGGLWAFGETLATTTTSPVPLFIFSFIDSFKYELVTLFVLFLGIQLLPPIDLYALREGLVRDWNVRDRTHLWIVAGLLVGSAALGAFQFPMYIVGKQYYLFHTRPKLLRAKANSAFTDGHPGLARWYLMACTVPVSNNRCSRVLAELDARTEKAHALARIYDRLALSDPLKLKVLQGMTYLSGDTEAYASELRSVERAFTQARSQFALAIRSLAEGNYNTAQQQLKQLHENMPGFGDEMILEQEARNMAERDTPQQEISFDKTPYLASLKEYGEEEFLRLVLAPHARVLQEAKNYVPVWKVGLYK